MAIEVFKIINKQTPVYLHDLVTIKKVGIKIQNKAST
jgi:hypothetical protein